MVTRRGHKEPRQFFPARSIMTDRRLHQLTTPLCSLQSTKKKGASVFEKRLVELGIRQILAGVILISHPLRHLDGKLEHAKMHGTRSSSPRTLTAFKLLLQFEAIMMRKTRPVRWTCSWNGTTTGGPTFASVLDLAWTAARGRCRSQV